MSAAENPYAARRERLMDERPDGLILVRGRGPAESGGLNPSFVYLTGIREPQGVLLLAPGGARVVAGRSGKPGPDYMNGRILRQMLFLPAADPLAARWGEDAAATLESVKAREVGVSEVLPVSSLSTVLSQALQSVSTLHYVRARPASLVTPNDGEAAFIAQVRRQFFHLQFEDATPDVHEMRRSKDAGELRAIERAVAVVAEALARVAPRIRPGVREHEIESEIVAVYRKHGGVHAFDPIVATGPNALKLHYRDNAAELADGDLLLIDTGVNLHGYSADITRTYPVGGTFSPRQREVYEAVLKAQRAAIEACRPGALLGNLHARAYEAIATAGFGDHFVHGLGHHLGLETHDVGDIHRPLAEGAVITVEPGVYVEDEAIGVRIEDDVAITADGHRVLSEAIPKDAEAVERDVRG